MATQRYISTSFWDDEWVQKLDPSEKFLYLYLMTNPLTNIAGVYKISAKRISFDTGFNSDTVGHILDKFEKARKIHRIGEYMVLPSWPKHQKWQTKKTIKTGIDAILFQLTAEELNELAKTGYKYDLKPFFDTLCIPYIYPIRPYAYQPSYLDSDSDSDSDSEIDSDTPFSPKTVPTFDDDEPTKHNVYTPNDSSSRIEVLRKAWNDHKLPEMRRTFLNFTDKERADCMRIISFYSNDEILSAMKNYKTIITSPEYDNDPKYQYKSFPAFMAKGVEKYNDTLNPLETYKKKPDKSAKPEKDYSKYNALMRS